MIEKLPLLSSEFEEWSWETQGISSSKSQKQNAYNALLNKGLCTSFARQVWNDVVFKIDEAFAEAGISWDTKYGDYTDALMSTVKGETAEFTATNFNAATANIKRLGTFRWNWERNNNVAGFLGREYVRGYSEYGEKSDFVYGWYILELTEKLNKLIRILKDEADFSEYESTEQVKTYLSAKVAGAQTSGLNFEKEIETIVSAKMAKAMAVAQTAQISGWSYHDGILLPRVPQKTEAIVSAATSGTGTADALGTKTLIYGDKGVSFASANLTELIFAGRLKHARQSITQIAAQMDASNICDVEYVAREISKDFARIVANLPWQMDVKARGETFADSRLLFVDGMKMEAQSHADTYLLPQMSVLDKAILSAMNNNASYQNSVLQYFVPQYIKKDMYAVTISKAMASIVFARPMATDSMIRSILQVEKNICSPVVLAWTGTGETLNVSEARAVQIKWLNAQEHGKSKENGSEIIYCDAVRMETQRKAESIAQGTIQKGIPLLLDVDVQEKTQVAGEIVPLPKRWFAWDKYEETKQESAIGTANAATLGNICVSGSVVCCALDLEFTKETWYDPVQNGTDLYVRSVHMQHDEDTNVHIGHKFFEAEQNGNDLYIRSAYIRNQSQSDVDLGIVYYEPEQTETNIYIRSVETLKGV